MKVNREELSKTLNNVSPGLASKEVLEQSKSFVFKDGQVITFNDEVTVKATSNLDMECVVPSAQLLKLLDKMPDKTINIMLKDNQLVIKGKRKTAKITIEQEIALPVDKVRYPKSYKTEIPDGFVDILVACSTTCSKDLTRPVLTCVHVNGEHMESSDNFRACRYMIKDMGVEILIPSAVIEHLKNYELQSMGTTKSWIHFKCAGDVIFSFRRLNEDFPDLDGAGLFAHKGDKFKIPDELNKTLDRAGIFSKADFEQDEIVKLEIGDGQMIVSAQNELSSYEEEIDCESKIKQPVGFEIHPKFLLEVKKGSTACVGQRTLSIRSKKFQYVALLSLI